MSIEDRGVTIEDRGVLIEARGVTIEDRGVSQFYTAIDFLSITAFHSTGPLMRPSFCQDRHCTGIWMQPSYQGMVRIGL